MRQREEGIVEPVSSPPVGQQFHNPHEAAVREAAELLKPWIVYDASASESEKSPSLDECLEAGPPLQNRLWALLVRIRFQQVALTGDMKQTSLQVRTREEDRDALWFHWISDLETRRVEVLRLMRALFGLAPSPFLLGGVIKQHLETCRATFPRLIQQTEKSLLFTTWLVVVLKYTLLRKSKRVLSTSLDNSCSSFTSGSQMFLS